jgi:hypothetical protein
VSDVFNYLQEKMDEEIRVISESLANGNARDHAEYRHAVGVIRGLNIAHDIISDVSKRMEEVDD